MGRVVIVSNRLPGRGVQAGGLAVALHEALKGEVLWFGWSGRTAEATGTTAEVREVGGRAYASIDLSADDYQRYYVGFANGVLWPLLHFRLGLIEFRREEMEGYLAVNRAFAAALAPLLKPDDVVWVHDYHLIPLAALLRRAGVKNRIGFFLHIPFVPASIFDALPRGGELLRSLLDYDLVGVQTERDRQHLLDCLAQLDDPPPPETLKLIALPIGIDARGFTRQAEKSARSGDASRLRDSLVGRDLILGVDRLDYSKGLPQRFDAYRRLLNLNPQHRLKVSYLQVAARSREDVKRYQELGRQLDQMAGSVNGRFAEFDWVPLRYMTRPIGRATLAGFYRVARVGLVTPLRDGMNLVAKEFVAAQDPENPGVLVLSRFAGAAQELDAAVLVNPYDSEAIAESLDVALRMPLDERRERHQAMLAKVQRVTAASWCRDFLAALRADSPVLTASAWPQPGARPVTAQSGSPPGPGGIKVRAATAAKPAFAR